MRDLEAEVTVVLFKGRNDGKESSMAKVSICKDLFPRVNLKKKKKMFLLLCSGSFIMKTFIVLATAKASSLSLNLGALSVAEN